MAGNTPLRIVKSATLIGTLMASLISAGQQGRRPSQQSAATPPTASSTPTKGGSGDSRFGNAANPQTTAQIPNGIIRGRVYWDLSVVKSNLSNPCQGLQMTLSDGTRVLGTSNFMLIPTDVVSGREFVFCAYEFRNVPEHEPLQVQARIVQPSAFTPSASVTGPLGVPASGLTIPGKTGGNCTPPVNLNISEALNSGPMICDNRAFNINFTLVPSRGVAIVSPAATKILPPTGPKPAVAPEKAAPLLRNPGPGLISGLSGNGNAGGNGNGHMALSGGPRPSLPAAFAGGHRVVTGKRIRNSAAESSAIMAVLRQQKHTLAAGSRASGSRQLAPNLKLQAVAPYTPSSLLTPLENSWCQDIEAKNLTTIFRVAGKPLGQDVVYSPDPQANPYTIVGCGFGNTTGNVILDFLPNGGYVPAQVRALSIQTWNDHEIVASLDQNTSGLSDCGIVRLFVEVQATVSGGIVSADGSFYARRQTIPLPSLPQTQASLYQQGSPYFLSPASDYYGLNGTVAVMRQGLPGPVAGQDKFTLKLAPGFVVDSTQTDLLASNTAASVTTKPAAVTGNTITVTYPIVSDTSGTSTNYYSIYGLTIWVTGPAGVTP